MKKSEIKVGGTYAAKVSGIRARVRITSESPYGGWVGVNLDTNKDVRIKTAARLRYPLEKMPKEYGPSYFAEKMHGLPAAAKRVATEEKILNLPMVTEKIQ